MEEAGNDWFSLRFDLEVDGRRIPLLPLVSDLLADYRPGGLPEILYVDAGGGHYVAVPGACLEPVLQTIIDLYDRDGGRAWRCPASTLRGCWNWATPRCAACGRSGACVASRACGPSSCPPPSTAPRAPTSSAG